MRRQEAEGFTLIELVMVIVILGILAAVAVPRYLNLTAESQTATLNAGVSSSGSGIAIAAARNRSTFLAPTVDHVIAELPGSSCSDAGNTVAFIVQGRVNVTLIGATASTGGVSTTATLVNCEISGTTVVQGVSVGIYSA